MPTKGVFWLIFKCYNFSSNIFLDLVICKVRNIVNLIYSIRAGFGSLVFKRIGQIGLSVINLSLLVRQVQPILCKHLTGRARHYLDYLTGINLFHWVYLRPKKSFYRGEGAFKEDLLCFDLIVASLFDL